MLITKCRIENFIISNHSIERVQRRQSSIYDSCNPGFTLLELIVVIFIISLSLAIIFPSFYRFSEKKIKADARRMASVLRYLNDSAVSTKENYFLKFDLEKSIIFWKGPDGTKTEKINTLSSLDLQSRGEIKEGQVITFFGPLGAQENIAINLRDGGEMMTVILNSMSGRVKIVTSNQQ